jgi:hypothetical protein
MDKQALSFVENRGQFAPQVRFQLRMRAYTLWLTDDGVVFDMVRTGSGTRTRQPGLELGEVIPRHDDSHTAVAERLVFAQEFIGASGSPAIEVSEARPGVHNYFIGSVPSKWRTGVRSYGEVLYKDVWQGIDLRLHGIEADLEQDFVINPGADLDRVRVAYRGIGSLRIAQDGAMVVETAFGEFRASKPRIYQEINGKKKEVAGGFKPINGTTFAFEVSAYNHDYALVVDPTLIFSTYLGGSGSEEAQGIALDAFGNVYVTGATTSTDFPTTLGAIQTHIAGMKDAFITKLTSSGSGLVYSTYFGGSADDGGGGIAVDSLGNAYVAGSTLSTDFPTTPGAFQTTFGGSSFAGGDAFVMKIDPSGSRVLYSTYLGGNGFDEARGLAIDGAGNAYIAGITISSNFPTTPGAFQVNRRGGGEQGFVTKLNQSGSGLVYSTYLGGSVLDEAIGIAVDASGGAYVTGVTRSGDFPTTPSAFQTAPGGGDDAFVAKFNPSGSALIYSTFLGGNGLDQGIRIVVDSLPNPNAYVVGATGSTNFPTTPGAFQIAFQGGNMDAFVAKINPLGTALVYSTYLGGNGDDDGLGIALDSSGNVYVTGATISTNFPMLNPVQAGLAGRFDAFVAKMNASGSGLVYSTYLGGSGDDEGVALAVDSTGNAFVVGDTASVDFPTTPSSFRPQPPGNSDVFVSMIGSRSSVSASISTIQPNKGGDIGPVTVFINGGGFVSGATVKLVQAGQPDIAGTPVSVAIDGSSIRTTFDLRGKALGAWDVIVNDPNSGSVTDPGAFTIEKGRPPEVWVDIIGVDKIRVGQEQTFYVVYGNQGDVDAVGVPIWIGGIPPEAEAKLKFELIDAAGVPTQLAPIQRGNALVFPLFLPVIPAGSNGILPFALNVPAGSDFEIQTLANPIYFRSPLSSADVDCLLAIANIAVGVIGGSCAADLTSHFSSEALSIIDFLKSTKDRPVLSLADFLKSTIFQTISLSVSECAINPAKLAGLLDGIDQAVNLALAVPQAIVECNTATLEEHLRIQREQRVSSLDPNEKIGSRGVGIQQFISGATPLRYAVFFANKEAATAPAQVVVLSDQLDAMNDDLATFSFGPILFANQQVSVPPFKTDFTTKVDLRPENNLIVAVNAHLDSPTGLLTWRFSSLDPSTGNPPADPSVGFLPPGGVGSAVFTVMPKQGLATNTQIQNQATIVFDVNAPTSTQTWLNTLDNTKPVSHVLPLPTTQCSPRFQVQWTGSDVGSGVQDFTIFVSVDGDPFVPFLANTTSTSATFNGQTGHSYSFFSTARDLVGNVEDSKTTAEVSTQVFADTTPPTTTASVSPGPNANGWNNTNVSVSLSAADDPAGWGVKEIHFSVRGAQSGGDIVTGNNASFSITAEGITTVTYFATDNAGNQESPKTLTIRIDKTPPTIAGLPAPGCSLWPPNHKMIQVATVSAADFLSGLASFNFSGTSNEPSDPNSPDIVIAGTGLQPRTVQLRRDRLGTGSGRVYTLSAIATDLAGNTTTSSAVCVVPHDQGH